MIIEHSKHITEQHFGSKSIVYYDETMIKRLFDMLKESI